MTRAKTEQAKFVPWFAKAGAACSIVPIARFVNEHIFALKGGGYGCLFSLAGIDEEGLTDPELEARMRSLEGALHGLPEGSCLYQYTRLMSGFELPRRPHYQNPVTQVFADDRLTFLERTAGFRRIDLHWCLTIEPPRIKAFQQKPKELAADTSRMLAELEKTATILEGHLGSSLGLRLLGKDAAFQFFSYVFNLEEWAEDDQLRANTGVDRQIVKNPITWHSDHLRVGKRYVQMFSLKATPEASRPCLFSSLLTLDCDSIVCSTWRPKSTAAARSEIDAQEKFISFFKVGVLTRVMSGRDTASLETGAGAKAANSSVDDLSEVIRSLDKKSQGEYSLRLLLAANSPEHLRDTIPAVHRAFVDARTQMIEESLGNLSAFYAMFPGNGKFNVFPLWLSEDHHARLSSIFAPHLGHPHSEDLDAEYLNVFETRTRTPFFQDVYVDGVRVMLILGPTGTGKSVHGNQLIALEQKYGGFSYIFDIGGSYESVVELYGGRVDRIGKDGPRVNPFALEPTESNLKFLYTFIRLLLANGGAELEPEDDDVIHKAVQDMYLLDRENRRLSNLYLPKKLDRYLSKWVRDGVYHAIFDNVEDGLSLSRVQCFDFAGVNNEQYADLIEPLMVWLLRRINDVLHDPANLGVPKHILIEELFPSMKNRQLLEGALSSIKTVRKNLGGVTLIGQSAEDLGENADSIVNSCSSFLLLKDPTFNRKRYAELFRMNEQQLALFESLQDREALYIRRDGLTKVVILNLDSRSYATFSTKPKDRVRRSKLIAKYGLAEGIDRFAQGEIA
ncbi:MULTISPECIES: VirB4 family type IV secretion system protein [Acidobacterium]|uniref:Type IV secretion/conjugal transfer ATPase, VirB4 family n=1 Tax=Acidobacterium capsulatum (strain ATCC 51196 / DSM 11244 / BCRC 80197 / JCM 7670 / NBRC 15755 / NCIMB 13165 / 161) TaxID=240015 RepID=C1F578_ACIC5|nr:MULTISPECIES: VirB4 family type IV secretion system protein [Acidobacterium]ACO34606.1 type IV secretion/conjugal transfer ATPase, VirB4 family [Acidobacterium capsulatum ATCC 51196]HCT61192.1 type VI secretion protein [Acidobacterium sp.]